MALDPPPEAGTWTTILQAATWAGLSGEPDDQKTELGSLLLRFGAKATMHPRVLGAMEEKDFEAVYQPPEGGEAAQGWTIDSQPPTPVQATIAGLLGRACRIAVGTQKRSSEIEAALKAAEEHEQQLEIAKAKSSGAPPQQMIHAQPKGRTVKLSATISQSAEQECSILEPDRLKEAYANYNTVFRQMPPPGEELTAEQLTGLDALLKDVSQPVPYLDFGVWGPHHHRLEKKIKLQGSTFDSQGRLRHIELLGPENPDKWHESYACLRTGFVMFNVVSLGNIDNYQRHIARYIKRYGMSLWYLVYQADVRMRQEGMERIRRRGEIERQEAIDANGKHEYNPNRPWDWVWSQAVLDNRFWKEELEEQALLVLTRTSSLSSMIDGDVRIDNPGAPHAPPPRAPDLKRSAADLSLTPPKSKVQKGHHVSNGKYTHNRSGAELCAGFQDGSCTERGQGTRCRKDPGKAHHCNNCLSPDHGGSNCSKGSAPSQQPGRWKGGNKGGGKGKGKGKGQWQAHF